MMILHGWRQILDMLFPRVCGLCRQMVVDGQSASLCQECQEGFSPIQRGCSRCGAPVRLGESLEREVSGVAGGESKRAGGRRPSRSDCRFCKSQRWEFGRAWCYTVYGSNAAQAVRLMKESHCESLACDIGDLLAGWLRVQPGFSSENYDCIVPIPQYWIRRLTQRYNQASALGERVSREFGLPCSEWLLRRTRWTQKQGMKTISERRENLLGAFTVPWPAKVRYRSFLIIDDVMTSGATVQEAAKALKQAGARRVDAVVFARGVNASKPGGRTENSTGSGVPMIFQQNNEQITPLKTEQIRRRIH